MNKIICLEEINMVISFLEIRILKKNFPFLQNIKKIYIQISQSVCIYKYSMQINYKYPDWNERLLVNKIFFCNQVKEKVINHCIYIYICLNYL